MPAYWQGTSLVYIHIGLLTQPPALRLLSVGSHAGVLTLTSKGLSFVKIASPNVDTSNRSANDEALLRCRTALEQKDREDYAGAQKTMRSFWPALGASPRTAGLDLPVSAEILLCTGIL